MAWRARKQAKPVCRRRGGGGRLGGGGLQRGEQGYRPSQVRLTRDWIFSGILTVC